MRWLRKISHPLTTFIAIQLVWLLLVIFWIDWFVERHKEFTELAARYRPDAVLRELDWIVLVEGLALLLAVLVGVYVLFLFYRRQSDLYRRQRDFISQVTHELKSPLASIQLHLETIRLRKPAPEKLDSFLETMLADTDRLNNLISNLLMAAKLEYGKKRLRPPAVDISAFLTDYFEGIRNKLPEGTSLSLNIESGLRAGIEPESFRVALRNLVENAVLYSPSPPEIEIAANAEGKKCIITVRDRGIGMSPKEAEKVFHKFYRIRRPGDNIRGTGLGLYIVKSIVEDHGGKVFAHSEGPGKGCEFVIVLHSEEG